MTVLRNPVILPPPAGRALALLVSPSARSEDHAADEEGGHDGQVEFSA